MKILLMLSVVFLLTVFCRAQIIEEKIGNDACICLDTLTFADDSDAFMQSFMKTCLQNSFLKFEDEIKGTFGVSGDNGYSEGYEVGKNLAPKVFGSLVLNCDKFFYFFDSLRFAGKNAGDKSAIDSMFLLIDRKIKFGEKNVDSYYGRAMCFFLLGKYKKSRQDLETILSLDENFAAAYLYRGWVKEIHKDYEGAKSDYQRYMDLTGSNLAIILVNVVKRKMKGP
jgi:tetratricopeptide (TPR) repeat protein